MGVNDSAYSRQQGLKGTMASLVISTCTTSFGKPTRKRAVSMWATWPVEFPAAWNGTGDNKELFPTFMGKVQGKNEDWTYDLKFAHNYAYVIGTLAILLT